MTQVELRLPPALEADAAAGARLSDAERAALKSLLTRVKAPLPCLYDYEGMKLENSLWTSDECEFYLGSSSKHYYPGDIDPQRAVIIGEAEPDSPIALDYRTDPPRVVYLGTADNKSYWFELADSYERLRAKLQSLASGAR